MSNAHHANALRSALCPKADAADAQPDVYAPLEYNFLIKFFSGNGALGTVRCGGQGQAWSGVCDEVFWYVCVVRWAARGCGGGGHAVYAVVWWPVGAV